MVSDLEKTGEEDSANRTYGAITKVQYWVTWAYLGRNIRNRGRGNSCHPVNACVSGAGRFRHLSYRTWGCENVLICLEQRSALYTLETRCDLRE
jgi:hypothetical protein